jgi:methylase of polypeptide subunit release factors
MTSQIEYYKLDPEAIRENVNEMHGKTIKAEVEGVSFEVFPHVYPSQKFRTTAFVLRSLKPLLNGKTVCDMGCGPGIVGLFSLFNGASRVVQADINPNAVKNAKRNNKLNAFSDKKIKTYLSDCFDKIPKNTFDLIVFNMPYHRDEVTISDPLQYAFYDPAFASIKKFLSQVREYAHKDTQVFIAFSNKGDVQLLEAIFNCSGFDWDLWKITNTDQEYDNRLYRLCIV